MATSDTLINTLFDGRYRIVRRLGRGGMADVYLAEDEELGRRVAIKILNERHAADEQFVERFRREATNAAGLSHPNIVSIYDRGEAEGTYYIAMEYLEGSTLKDILAQRGPLPVGDAIDFTRHILDALKVAHRKGIVHRDIKPHNVMCDADGRVKVTDFGIARAGASQMTEAGSIIGTAQYLSPEQARGGVVDARSDLYSVGIVLYELLTGTVPFTGDTSVEIAMKHLSTTPEPPSARRPDLPQALDQIVLRALAKDPDERYQTAEEMDAELARVAEGFPVSPETADAATQVLAGAGAIDTAATAIARAPTAITPRPAAPPAVIPPYRPPSRGYYYEEPPPRRRAVWPWIVVALLLLAAGAAVFLAWGKIQDQLNSNKAVAVPNVVGIKEILAVRKLREAGLTVTSGTGGNSSIRRVPSATVPVAIVIEQDPQAGDKVPKGKLVNLQVSAGAPEAVVPDVRGKTLTDAIETLAGRGLRASAMDVPSTKPPQTIVAQDPAPGTKVPTKTTVHINVSKGPEQAAVPNVVGQTYDAAAQQLQSQGFAIARTDQASNEQAGVVIAQNPVANSVSSKGAKVTLYVSKGPTAVQIPDVTGEDEATATAQLQGKDFVVQSRDRITSDSTEEGLVVEQRPGALSKVKPGSTVTLFIGRFQGTSSSTTASTTTSTTTTVP
jgi:beta-lactam-binding protein with PASTA domain